MAGDGKPPDRKAPQRRAPPFQTDVAAAAIRDRWLVWKESAMGVRQRDRETLRRLEGQSTEAITTVRGEIFD